MTWPWIAVAIIAALVLVEAVSLYRFFDRRNEERCAYKRDWVIRRSGDKP